MQGGGISRAAVKRAETVLLDADSSVKRQYAGLLLKTAGDERGFTTCLSASAGALRYRLKRPEGPPAIGPAEPTPGRRGPQ